MSALDIERVYETYSDKVMSYLMARLRNRAEAEDLCSEVFEKVLTKMDRFDPEKSAVGTWIFSITRNALIDHYRRMRPFEELDENLSEDGEVDEELLQTESLSELAAALKKLPQQLMDIVILRYYDGKPLTEIAKMMDLSYGAVKLRHQNALMLLRSYMS